MPSPVSAPSLARVTDRRNLLRAIGAATGTVGVAVAATFPSAAATSAKPVFVHGVASGDPVQDGVLL